jgi:hypothetical protein
MTAGSDDGLAAGLNRVDEVDESTRRKTGVN